MEVIQDQFLWVEKYRPQKLKDVIIPDSLRQRLEKYVEQGQIPNFMFYSNSPGTGKTTVAKAICNEFNIRPLFINGSSQNSIDDVRTIIKDYATTISLMGNSFKVVIVDEFDRFSTAAQDALKALMEEVSSNCRFIFTANSKAKIAEPILSRCVEVDFVYSKDETKLLAAKMYKRVIEILDNENVTYNVKVVANVVVKFSPDNRKILQVLQNYAATNGGINEGILLELKGAEVSALVGFIKTKDFKNVLQWCQDNQEAVNDDFYLHLYRGLKDEITPQSVPELILILGAEQKVHAIVADMFLHGAQLCTQLMMNLTFKG